MSFVVTLNLKPINPKQKRCSEYTWRSGSSCLLRVRVRLPACLFVERLLESCFFLFFGQMVCCLLP